MKKVLVPDVQRCIGCRMCEAVCSLTKHGSTSISNSRIKMLRYDSQAFFYPLVCLQCEVPRCALVCPTGALWKNLATGVVELIEERCVGCKMCLVACPFGAISFVNGVAIKCDLCGGDPTCVKFCEPKALTYGEADDVGLAKRLAVSEKMMKIYGVELAERAAESSLKEKIDIYQSTG